MWTAFAGVEAMKKLLFTILSLALALLLCACRVRTTLIEPPVPEMPETATQEADAPARIGAPVEPQDTSDETPAEERGEPDADAPAERDEDATRREFEADASGELTPDAEAPLYTASDAPADASAPPAAPPAVEPAAVETEGAALTATETVPAEEAERLGADESGEVAESVLTYYQTLLESRLGNLFECKRLYVYWETDEDHRTIHRSSPEHQIILNAGAYDVSAKLQEDGLTVDDGWVLRKAPDAVVKVADGGALDAGAARELCIALAERPDWAGVSAVRERRVLVFSERLLDTQAGRTAAAVFLAKLLYPAQLEDVDADEALRALTEEAGGAYSGVYAYSM